MATPMLCFTILAFSLCNFILSRSLWVFYYVKWNLMSNIGPVFLNESVNHVRPGVLCFLQRKNCAEQEDWLHHLLWNLWILKFFSCPTNSSASAQNVVSQCNWKKTCPVTVNGVFILVKWRLHSVEYEKTWFQPWKYDTIAY